MSSFTSPAILLRRMDLGDHDLLVTFFTLDRGKTSAVAKFAKKSVKRFAGVLEPFSVVQAVFKPTRGRGLPVLQEATLVHPFSRIRYDVTKTAYASYWAELVNNWVEAEQPNKDLFHLLEYGFQGLDGTCLSEAELSILFQIRFMVLSGFSPDLTRCRVCGTAADRLAEDPIAFDLVKGGLVCQNCIRDDGRRVMLSKGTCKQMLWLQNNDLKTAGRIRFAQRALAEGLALLEAFVPYHLGRVPKSLKVLRQIRANRR